MSVVSPSSASVVVQSGGAHRSIVNLRASESQETKVCLGNSNQDRRSCLVSHPGQAKALSLWQGGTNLLTFNSCRNSGNPGCLAGSLMQTHGDLLLYNPATANRTLTVESRGGSATLSVASNSSQSMLAVTSLGAYESSIRLSAQVEQSTSVVLQCGSNQTFTMQNTIVQRGGFGSGTASFVISDDSNQLLVMQHQAGSVGIRGSVQLTEGVGAHSLLVKSASDSATLTAGTFAGSSKSRLLIHSALQTEPTIRFGAGNQSYSLSKIGNLLQLRSGVSDNLITISQAAKTITLHKQVSIGVAAAASELTILSSNASAAMMVQSNSTVAQVRVTSGDPDVVSELRLKAGSNTTLLQTANKSDFLLLSNGEQQNSHIWSVSRTSGNNVFRGDFRLISSLQHQVDVTSIDSTAMAVVNSAGSLAQVLVSATEHRAAIVKLLAGEHSVQMEARNHSLTLKTGDEVELMQFRSALDNHTRNSSLMTARGNVVVGGNTQKRSLTLKSLDSSVAVKVQAHLDSQLLLVSPATATSRMELGVVGAVAFGMEVSAASFSIHSSASNLANQPQMFDQDANQPQIPLLEVVGANSSIKTRGDLLIGDGLVPGKLCRLL